MTRQCNVINLNLTNVNTLLSKKLHLATSQTHSQPTENITDEDADLNSSSKPSLNITAKPLQQQQISTNGIYNFQNTLRTYCLTDCDYLTRQKRQRLKNFNAKIRQSIKAQVKRRQKDSKLLQKLDQESNNNNNDDDADDSFAEDISEKPVEFDKSKTMVKEITSNKSLQTLRSKSEVTNETVGSFKVSYSSPYSEQFKPVTVPGNETVKININQKSTSENKTYNNNNHNVFKNLHHKRSVKNG